MYYAHIKEKKRVFVYANEESCPDGNYVECIDTINYSEFMEMMGEFKNNKGYHFAFQPRFGGGLDGTLLCDIVFESLRRNNMDRIIINMLSDTTMIDYGLDEIKDE